MFRTRSLIAVSATCAVAVPAVALAQGSSQLEAAPPSAVALHASLSDHATVRSAFREARHAQLRREARRAARRRAKAAAAAAAVRPTGKLAAIAQCESGGNPRAVDASGTYFGWFQFDRGTWASVGGTGSPADAPPAEQIKRAKLLMARAGTAPWPVCGR